MLPTAQARLPAAFTARIKAEDEGGRTRGPDKGHRGRLKETPSVRIPEPANARLLRPDHVAARGPLAVASVAIWARRLTARADDAHR